MFLHPETIQNGVDFFVISGQIIGYATVLYTGFYGLDKLWTKIRTPKAPKGASRNID